MDSDKILKISLFIIFTAVASIVNNILIYSILILFALFSTFTIRKRNLAIINSLYYVCIVFGSTYFFFSNIRNDTDLISKNGIIHYIDLIGVYYLCVYGACVIGLIIFEIMAFIYKSMIIKEIKNLKCDMRRLSNPDEIELNRREIVELEGNLFWIKKHTLNKS